MSIQLSPSLTLPPPPIGRSGFPWDPAATAISPPEDPAHPWPRLTVATPSYNQGKYLEETIRSVLQQGYPNLEYIIVDGGSRDGSVGIIRKYESWLAHWESGKDRGQVHAIQKCFNHATGEFFNWINSDDLLAPGALFKVAQAALDCDLVAGACYNFDSAGHRTLICNSGLVLAELLVGSEASVFHQPGIWWRREWLGRCGGFDERFDLAFDYDLLLRYLSLDPRVSYVPEVLAHFRLHPLSKTCSRAGDYGSERERILEDLATHARSAWMRKACGRRLRQMRWWRQVAQISSSTHGSTMARAVRLALKALAEPAVRANRFTLGALRNIVTGRSAAAQEGESRVRAGTIE